MSGRSEGNRKLTIWDLEGVSDQTKKKLKNAGFYYVEDLLIFSPTKISELAGISADTAERLLERAADILYRMRREQTLKEFREEEGKKMFMSTGAHSLNRLLRGGWCVGEVTEIVGEYASGKSQAVYTALAIAFLDPKTPEEIQKILFGEDRKKHGEAKKVRRRHEDTHWGLNDGDISVLLIDAERTFSWQRFEKILARFNLRMSDIEERFYIYRPRNTWELKAEIDRLHSFVREKNIRLVAVDSITKLPRADYGGISQLYERQRVILEMVEKLRRLAQTYRIVVLITNQVVATPGALFGLGYKPVGGHVLGHTVDTRLLLVKSGEYRRAIILDSSWLPPGECKIRISEGGIEDA